MVMDSRQAYRRACLLIHSAKSEGIVRLSGTHAGSFFLFRCPRRKPSEDGARRGPRRMRATACRLGRRDAGSRRALELSTEISSVTDARYGSLAIVVAVSKLPASFAFVEKGGAAKVGRDPIQILGQRMPEGSLLHKCDRAPKLTAAPPDLSPGPKRRQTGNQIHGQGAKSWRLVVDAGPGSARLGFRPRGPVRRTA